MHILRGWIDSLICTLVIFMVIVSMMVVKKEESENAGKPIGSVIFTITWPDGDNDIDLWIAGPEEPKPIGYSNRAGNNLDLLRDDMGSLRDALPLNYENAITRAIKAGEYTVNVHCYRCADLKKEIPVTLEVVVNDEKGQRARHTKTVNLKFEGEEKTVVNFDLTESGQITNANDVFVPVRNVE